MRLPRSDIRSIIPAALAASAVLIVSACGSAGAAGSTNLGGGASLAPADSVAFVAVDTSMSSGQWDALNGLLDKFPSRDEFVAQLKQQFTKGTKLNWDTDVQPALSDELDVVVLPGAARDYVYLTQSHDQAKLDALVLKLDDVSKRIGAWTAVADSQAALDAVSSPGLRLADDARYSAASAKLDDDALVHAYANGEEAQKRLNPTIDPEHSVQFVWASADVTAAGDGLRLHVYSRDSQYPGVPVQRRPTTVAPYASHLVDEVPSDALALVDFWVRPGMFSLADPSVLPAPIRDLYEKEPTLPYELDTIFGGESAVYLRRGAFVPELTVVTQPNDTKQAEAALAEVEKTLKERGGALGQFTLFHEVIGGQLVISTSQKGIEDFRSGGDKLADDSSFKDAQKAVGMPAETTGFAYAKLKDLLPLVQALGPLLGLKLPPVLQGDDLSPLHTLAAYGSRTGEEENYSAYLQIQ